ncbi:hypothetical protein CR201_G0052238, partial [Pongo abelii]
KGKRVRSNENDVEERVQSMISKEEDYDSRKKNKESSKGYRKERVIKSSPPPDQ